MSGTFLRQMGLDGTIFLVGGECGRDEWGWVAVSVGGVLFDNACPVGISLPFIQNFHQLTKTW